MSLQPPVPHGLGKICKKRPNLKKNLLLYSQTCGGKTKCMFMVSMKIAIKVVKWPLSQEWTPKGRANMTIYCGIIIVRVGPKFVVSFDNPWPRIYIPTIVLSSSCLIFIKFIPITIPTKLRYHKPGKFLLPTSIDPHK